MASLPPKPAAPAGPTHGGDGASAGWARSGEPGTAFRGIVPRGRGSNRGTGRGGRGRSGRGGPKGAAAKNNETQAKIVERKAQAQASDIKPPPIERSTSTSTTTSTATATPASAASDRTQRPRLNTRRASGQQSSRKVPSLAIDPSTPIAETPTDSITGPLTRPNNRRRRSSQQSTKGNSISPNQTLTVDPKPMPGRSRKSLTGPPTPNPSSKDAPPHLSAGAETTSFDMNVHNLVEQMRASVIAGNRPTTPGSHIDWAGEDDDSLPDLDDWGYTTKTDPGTVTVEKANVISPILEGQLKPLPDFADVPKADTAVQDSSVEASVPEAPAEESKRTTEPVQAKTETRNNNSEVGSAKSDSGPSRRARRSSAAPRPAQTNAKEFRTPQTPLAGNGRRGTASVIPQGSAVHLPSRPSKIIPTGPSTLRGHPSLPPKPVPAVVPSPKPDTDQILPVQEPPTSASEAEVSQKSEPSANETDSPLAPSVAEGDRGQSESTSASNSSEPSAKTKSDDGFPSRGGLSASIHAPTAESTSSSENTSAYKATPPRTFDPTHGRSHTVGRLPGFRPSFGDPHPATRHTRSGSSTPRGAHLQDFAARHARTQSSPPTGEGVPRRAPHTTRPVISGDAISRLVRQLGGKDPLASPRSVATAATNN